jgi:hypothetical protein
MLARLALPNRQTIGQPKNSRANFLLSELEMQN